MSVLFMDWAVFMQSQIVSKPLAPCQNPRSYSNSILSLEKLAVVWGLAWNWNFDLTSWD